MCRCPEFVYRYVPGGRLCFCGHDDADHARGETHYGAAPIGRCTRVADTA